MNYLFKTKTQKLIWCLFSIWMVLVWIAADKANSNNLFCHTRGIGCSSIYPTLVTSLVITIVLTNVLNKESK
jgi:hypothetical protein